MTSLSIRGSSLKGMKITGLRLKYHNTPIIDGIRFVNENNGTIFPILYEVYQEKNAMVYHFISPLMFDQYTNGKIQIHRSVGAGQSLDLELITKSV